MHSQQTNQLLLGPSPFAQANQHNPSYFKAYLCNILWASILLMPGPCGLPAFYDNQPGPPPGSTQPAGYDFPQWTPTPSAGLPPCAAGMVMRLPNTATYRDILI